MSDLATKVCNTCGEEKTLEQFYRRADSIDGHHGRCKQCDCTRPRRLTKMKLIRVRARNRAQQQLADAHRDEYQMLYEQELVAAIEEADRIEARAEAEDVEVPQGETVRLRKGQRQPDEEAEDRIDTEWCRECAEYHKRGHRPCEPRRSAEDVLEDFDWLVAGGESPEHAAKRVGVSLQTIHIYRRRITERRAS